MRPLEPGTLIEGRYRLERKLGEGGYAVVFAAMDQSEGREVALKFLGRRAATRREGIARFEREARIVRELTHPNIVQTLGLGKTDDGIPFLVLELLEGETLGARIARVGALGLETTLHVGEQILRALWAAHERGIVHRDLKPDNIFLSQLTGAPDVARLLDFGVAHLRWDEGPTLTRASTVLGTPAYMSPEQVVGGPIDGRTDLYAMGLVLAECIEGAVVMGEGNPVKIALQHAAPEPIVLGPRVLGSPLRAAIARAVSKNPGERPQSAREMLQLFPARVTRPLSEIETAPTALAMIPDDISRDSTSLPGPLELHEPSAPPEPPEPPTIRGRTPPSGVIGRGFTAPARSVMVVPSAPAHAALDDGGVKFEPAPATVRIAPPPASSSNKTIAILVGALIAAALVGVGGYLFLVAQERKPAPQERSASRVDATCELPRDMNDLVIAGTPFTQAARSLEGKGLKAEPQLRVNGMRQQTFMSKDADDLVLVAVIDPAAELTLGKQANGSAAVAMVGGCRVSVIRWSQKGQPKQTAEKTMRDLFPNVGNIVTRAQ
jgi:serine/threonine protein kinase